MLHELGNSKGKREESQEEGELILKALKNIELIKIIKESCSWSNFRIDWRLFKYFNKTFYNKYV